MVLQALMHHQELYNLLLVAVVAVAVVAVAVAVVAVVVVAVVVVVVAVVVTFPCTIRPLSCHALISISKIKTLLIELLITHKSTYLEPLNFPTLSIDHNHVDNKIPHIS